MSTEIVTISSSKTKYKTSETNESRSRSINEHGALHDHFNCSTSPAKWQSNDFVEVYFYNE